jgi:ribosomal protein S18 acetylase RimI-like enzyme
METFPLYRWWKAHEVERIWPESMLKQQEMYCVTACSHFKRMNFQQDHAWVLSSKGAGVTALLLQFQNTLFPVFGGQTEFYIPPFMYRFFKNTNIHALHGLAADTDTLEKILRPAGLFARERRGFNLMALDAALSPRTFQVPRSLTLRKPALSDIDQLTPLQEAYQKEEVLRNPDEYSRKICRLGLKKIIEKDRALIAEIDGAIVGKINTNALAYNRYQLGGVYVLPAFRGRGIASCMTAAFTRILLAEGKGVSLFVKKNNKSAESVYRRCGFVKIADYSIVYM